MDGTPQKRQKWLYFAGIGFALTLILLLVLGIAFGVSYRKSLTNVVPEPQINEMTSLVGKKIKKVTFQKRYSSECIEVTADGIVRVYATCGKELNSADRLRDPKNIFKLYKLLTEKDYKSDSFTENDEVYLVTLETETGTQIFYFVADSKDTNIAELINTFNNILGDLPGASPTPNFALLSSSSPQVSASLPPPSGTSFYPTPSPSGASLTQTFTCDFSDAKGTKKPMNVSNVICTGDPSPAP